MFKKLKDKLAEEVKYSPQRFHQIAQAAQAAVTSASSSISDITNNDLFSIGGEDTPDNSSAKASPQSMQDTSFPQAASPTAGSMPLCQETVTNMEYNDDRRLRKLSNSSIASDVSFRLPSYESPSMYHLQSDMDISASEAEERGLTSIEGITNLDRVTKEQLYAAYRRTQERYGKYRARYADLIRHYKSLERENAKARSVLVETQDKALRRISELREQCALEQKAKAHLESVLRAEINTKTMNIDELEVQVKVLQTNSENKNGNLKSECPKTLHNNSENMQNLIDLSSEILSDKTDSELDVVNNKIKKMDQLISKYKESLKNVKEKNSQLTTEIQILSNELEKKTKESDQHQVSIKQLTEALKETHELKEINEDLQNKLNTAEFSKEKELSSLKVDMQQAENHINDLTTKLQNFTKREEDNAISLAENKLSIHKELESKESEIKSLRAKLATCNEEIHSLNIIINDCKKKHEHLEKETEKHNESLNELNIIKNKLAKYERELQELHKKYEVTDLQNTKANEDYKCLELQFKQETAEKLAVIDRNNYLEKRIMQISEDVAIKTKQIGKLERELINLSSDNDSEVNKLQKQNNDLLEELKVSKDKCNTLELEIQEEREELVKLQSEIEKLLLNDESLQNTNVELQLLVNKIKSENELLQNNLETDESLNVKYNMFVNKIKKIKSDLLLISNDSKKMQETLSHDLKLCFSEDIMNSINKLREEWKTCYNSIYTEKDQLIHEVVIMKDKIQTLEKENRSLGHELKESKENLETEKQEMLMYINELKSVESCKNDLEKKNQIISQENLHLMSQTKDMINNIKSLEIKLKEMCQSYAILEKEKHDLIAKLEIIDNQEIKKTELENRVYLETLAKNKYVENELDNIKKELTDCRDEKNRLSNKLLDIENNINTKEAEINEYKNKSNVWQEKMGTILDENNLLHEKCERLKQEKEKLHEHALSLEQTISSYDKKIKQNEESFIETDFLNLRVQQLENDLALSKGEVDGLKQINEILNRNVQDNESHCQIVNATVTKLQQDSIHLQDLINDLESEHVMLNTEKARSEAKLKEFQNDAEQNKYLLNKKICELTDELELKCRTITSYEMSSNVNSNVEATSHLNSNGKTNNDDVVVFINENNKLKEDNKRLLADIEGLQAHLAKVSKDNSQLNNKIREMMVNDENITIINDKVLNDNDTTNLKQDNKQLNKLLQANNDKLEDLERQNSILVEENLELHDQLQMRNDTCNHDNVNNKKSFNESDLELNRLQEKYNKLFHIKSELESKLADMELLGRTNDKSVDQLEQKNEKLRLSNEKLERRLDEALVSLRHLRALEESTELEYLRNILYEYLTGPGTHSTTLAKVLSAVVKFDERQTQLVLQREKERQGLLGQFGLL